MVAQIVIYHLSGAKLKQVEQFALEAFTEITIGRDRAATIRFDDADDQQVADRHAVIAIAGEPPRFRLKDCGSRTGTLLNGLRVQREAELSAGDEIELGPGGPKFVFDLQPGPVPLAVRRIRIPDAEPPAERSSSGRALAVVPAAAPAAPAANDRGLRVPPPPALRRAAPHRLRFVLVAVVLLLAAAGGAIYRANPGGEAPGAVPAAGTPLIPPAETATAAATPDASPVADIDHGPAPAETAPAAKAVVAEAPAVEAKPRPDLAGTVRKIAGASRFEVADRWIELYGVDDPTIAGEHNQAVYDYLKPFAGDIECYAKGGGRFACFGGGQDLAVIAIDKGFVTLTAEAPREYRRLMRQRAAADR